MRKFVAILAAVLVTPVILVGGATAASAQPQPPRECSASYHGVLGGEAVTVFCDFGPTPYFRVVAYCESGFDQWRALGRVAGTGYETSGAECRGGLLTTARVGGYHVEWV
jgi:hypothetical protein